VITAIVMINAATDSIPEVAQGIADLDGISEVYSVAGHFDLIAVVRVKSYDEVADVIAGRLSKVPGVRDAYRLPGIFPARSRGGLRHRLRRRRLIPDGYLRPSATR